MAHCPDARTLALRALEALDRREAFADAVLDGLLSRHPGLPTRDRSLASHMVYGVLRWRNRLDAHIARASNRPLAKIHPLLLQVLRLGAYQILFLDRVPDRAAVNESVELARRAGLGHCAGFANAVLRNVVRQGPELSLSDDPAARLSLLFGTPEWLVELWMAEHGLEGAEALCGAASRVPPLWLRVETRRLSREDALGALERAGIDAVAGAHGPEAVLAASSGDPREIPLVATGQAVVQDQASQLVAHLVAPARGWKILDACAAPGLKATHLASLAGGGATVTALDVHPHRARMVRDLGRRLGYRQLKVLVADARAFRSPEPFDAVLVDAPCSGLGVLARNPEAKWRRSPEDLATFPPLQLELLDNLADAVRPGGLLVYATCTTVRAENEAVAEAFLARRADFELEPPPEGPVDWQGMVTHQGYFRTYPGPALGEGPLAVDGFFAARFRRTGMGR